MKPQAPQPPSPPRPHLKDERLIKETQQTCVEIMMNLLHHEQIVAEGIVHTTHGAELFTLYAKLKHIEQIDQLHKLPPERGDDV